MSDLIRLLPLDSGSDLYVYKHPDVPASLLYLVRPYQPKDGPAIYRLVAAAYEEEIDAPMGKERPLSCYNESYAENTHC